MILLIATNAALIGLSRLTFSMGQHRQLPERLRQIHPRYKTPYVAIVVFSAVAALVMLPGETELPGDDLLVRRDALVHVAHVSVIRLRFSAARPAPTATERALEPARQLPRFGASRCR